MSWSLSAYGHITGPEDDARQAEEELVSKLREVLADPRYGCTGSSFGGQHTGQRNVLEVKPDESP